MYTNSYVSPIRKDFELQNSQNVSVPLEMDTFLNCIKNFSKCLFLSLHFLRLSSENRLMLTLSAINVPLK